MPTIIYMLPDGGRRTVETASGITVARATIDAGVPGILAECGGACACATCHVCLDKTFSGVLEAPEPLEEDMLDCTAAPRRPNSRLSCQIRMSDALSGLIVHVPDWRIP